MALQFTPNKTRRMAVAGTFYPAEPGPLTAWMEQALAAAPPDGHDYKALIVPHAGYRYSGAIAATAYAAVRPYAARIRRVILFGPAHHGRLAGCAVNDVNDVQTPFGSLTVDRAAMAEVLHLPGVTRANGLHRPEHSLETQYPFLRHLYGDAIQILPVLVGAAPPEQVATVIDALWGGDETLIVISSDLSHFLSAAAARDSDDAAARAIERLQPDALGDTQACGRHAVRGLLHLARQRGMRATALDLCHSGDVTGDLTRVVGYGAFGFEAAAKARLTVAERRTLLAQIPKALAYRARYGQVPESIEEPFARHLQAQRASFVTLKKAVSGSAGAQKLVLRGCIGSVLAHQPLITDVIHNSCKAGFEDRRFTPLQSGEFAALTASISILSVPRPLFAASEAEAIDALRPGEDGVLLRSGSKQSVYLPQVWQQLPRPQDFLQQLKRKAGLAEAAWPDNLALYRFTAESFSSALQP